MCQDIQRFYDDGNDRFVVSLVVGYVRDDADMELLLQEFGEGEDPMLAACAAALGLTRDAGSYGTHWYVYDRLTGQGKYVEQGDFDTRED